MEEQILQKPTEKKMRRIKLDKVVLNLAVGNDEAKLVKAIKLLESITERKPIKTLARKRIAAWKLRPGLPIGCKVTLRGKKAQEILHRLLEGVEFKVDKGRFTDSGFSFGIKEYIQVPSIPYQREIGIIGFDVSVAFTRPGARVAKKKIKAGKIPRRHRLTKQEIINYAKENFKIILEKYDIF